MKNKKTKIIITLIIVLILIIFFQIKLLKKVSNDDFLFLKLFSVSQENSNKNNNEKSNIYKFNVKYKNTDFKSINLEDTIDRKTLVHEKIAPGTSGKFQIELSSNKKIKYQINLKNETPKPQNLFFKINIKNRDLLESNSLEELEKELQGVIYKNEKVIINFEWYWKFQDKYSTVTTDIQDTNDSKNIKQYKFIIQVKGVEDF